jgi:MYXO-CTERM domain-containing protein
MLGAVPQSLADPVWVDDAWTVRVYPSGGEDAFSAYDGTEVTVSSSAAAIAIVHDGPARALRYDVLAAPPVAVHVDGAPVDEVADLDAVELGWRVEGARVGVALPHAAGSSVIEIWYEDPPAGGSDGGATSAADETADGGDAPDGDGTGGPATDTGGATEGEGGANDDDGAGGCGCRSARPGPAGLALGGLIAIAIGRRRRRMRKGRRWPTSDRHYGGS